MRSEPRCARTPVWALSVSLAATPEITVVFSSSGYLDVSVHRVPFLTLWIGVRILEVFSSRFPHSEISGSMDICSSPKLFAAYHVFHRLLVPRHPPYALFSMTNKAFIHGLNYLLHRYSVIGVGFQVCFFTSFSRRCCKCFNITLLITITSDVLIRYFLSSFLVCGFQGTYDNQTFAPSPRNLRFSVTDIFQISSCVFLNVFVQVNLTQPFISRIGCSLIIKWR